MRYLVPVLFLLLQQCGPVRCEVQSQLLVNTSQGQVLGTVEKGIAAFKGIPYAAPPIGPLRWRAPRPPEKRSNVLIADRFGPACLQASIPGRARQESTSEDCLSLNIFKPVGIAEKVPVMVWVHGGGFVTGAGGNPFYDGSRLAADGVIVVTFNYRLGRLGWFAHPALRAEANGEPLANYGMMDQVAALRWVKDNIAGFGGDPENVTIFGESAGGMSVDFLMISQSAVGLFNKAITESGLGREPAHSLEQEEESGLEFAHSLAVPDDVDALRSIPAEKVISTEKKGFDDSLAKYSVIIDGVLVKENVLEAFRNGHERSIPFIVGTNDDEASLFPALRSGSSPLKSLLPHLDAESLRSVYPGASKDVAANIATDAIFTEPARFLARAHAAHAPTFRYLFSYVPEAKRAETSGAGHGHEIQFVFGNLGVRGGGIFTPRDEQTSKVLRQYWTNFAKNGDPNGGTLVRWERCCTKDEILFISNDGLSSKPEPWSERLDLLQKNAEPDRVDVRRAD